MVGFDLKMYEFVFDKEKAALHVDLHLDRLFFPLLVMSGLLFSGWSIVLSKLLRGGFNHFLFLFFVCLCLSLSHFLLISISALNSIRMDNEVNYTFSSCFDFPVCRLEADLYLCWFTVKRRHESPPDSR